MCGLAGLLEFKDGPTDVARSRVARMADRLAHRGPDAAGVWADECIALGHRRLSILDLSEAGAQPMHSACGRYVVAFNGEIYNHLDLRDDLVSAGCTPAWRGHSDTETLLAAITHWGIDRTLQRAAGMFALALWDRREKRLSLARDRIGEKPLYWGWAGRALVFGSELKALRAHPDFRNDVCPIALSQYLRFAYVPGPRSIHPGVYKLEPGCILEVDSSFPPAPPLVPLRPGDRIGALSIRRYWSLSTVIEAGARDPFTDSTDALAATERTMASAVRRQMLSDVPLGAFLSGGIDSSLIVALMQAQASRPVKTFTVGFENPAFDESPHAAAVAHHLGTEHSTMVVTEREARDIIPQMPRLYDEPFADSSQIPTYLVCKAARRSATVALSGDGGDELFGGYNRYVLGPEIWKRVEPVPFPIRQFMASAALAVSERGWNRLGALYNATRAPGKGLSALGQKVHRVAERLRQVDSIDALHRDLTSIWTAPSTLVAALPDGFTASLLDDALPIALVADPAGRMMAQDIRTYLPDDILCKVDRAAMGVSLETRVPFLDPEVVSLSARVPLNMKIRGGQGKWLLRQILYRHVPREMIERPKTGFSIPLADWLRGPLRAWAEEHLSTEALTRDGLLDPVPIRSAWTEHLTGDRDRSAQLWTILMYQVWREELTCA